MNLAELLTVPFKFLAAYVVGPLCATLGHNLAAVVLVGMATGLAASVALATRAIARGGEGGSF